MGRWWRWTAVGLLLIPALAGAQGRGTFMASDCLTITGPVTGLTWCFDTSAKTLKVWDGAAFVAANISGTLNNATFAGTTTLGGTLTGVPHWASAQTFPSLTVGGSPPAVQETGDLTLQCGRGPVFAPGFGFLTLRVRPGTKPGTMKLVAIVGSAKEEVVVVDNVPGGGC